jgi:hypothetical protein
MILSKRQLRQCHLKLPCNRGKHCGESERASVSMSVTQCFTLSAKLIPAPRYANTTHNSV